MTEKTNILLITSDQQHWNTLGLMNPEVKTPNLDRLAGEGTLFSRAYCPNPTCSPTRASIITGKYPSQHGCYTLGTKLPETEPTIGDAFQAGGYRTALIGKAHFQPLGSTQEFGSLESYERLPDLDFWRAFHGPFYGFDHVELVRNHTDEFLVGQHYAAWMEDKGFADWRQCFTRPVGTADPQHGTWNIPEEYHYDAWIAERTKSLLEEFKANGQNFFLWASFPDPHPPYLVPEPWDSMYDPQELTVPRALVDEHRFNPPHLRLTQEENPDFTPWRKTGFALHGFHSHKHDDAALAKDIATYYGMISLMDKYIGQILDELERLGLSENTLVVFTTDHGHFFGQHGLIAKGAFHYEDMIRVPFIVRHPGRTPRGKVSPAIQSLVDLGPTFLSAAGVHQPWGMSGLDQKDVWYGEADKVRDHAIVENRHEPDTIHCKTFVNQRYKITVYHNQTYGELFDLDEDPEEVRNLWSVPAYKDLKAELMMKFFFAEMAKEPLIMPRISGA